MYGTVLDLQRQKLDCSLCGLRVTARGAVYAKLRRFFFGEKRRFLYCRKEKLKMMKLRYLIENFELAKLALARYPHDEEILEECLRWFRISANAVYPYRHQGRLCFLRLAPVEEKQLSLVEGEIEYIRYLRTQGYPAMKPIGDAWLLDSPWGKWCASAFEGVPGRPVEDCVPSGELFFAMGASLGRMHVLSRTYQPVNRRPDHAAVLRQVRTMLTENNAPAAILEKLSLLEAELNALPVTDDIYGLLHYDFEPDNVFWDDQTRSCHVIDFDDVMYGWYALDVEQALDALGEITDENGEAQFMDGYRSVAPFSQEMESQRPLMRRMIRLRSYARLLHCLNDQIVNPPEWMTELCEKLNRAKERLEREI